MIIFKKALVMVAHPDDELMCAGTILKLLDNGCAVRMIVSSRPQSADFDRWSEYQSSLRILGLTGDLQTLRDDDEGTFAWTGEHVASLDLTTSEWYPDLIITHRVRDSQQHHSHMANVVHSIARKNNITVWEMEQTLPGGIEPDAPSPNFFVDVTDYWDVKQKIIDAYPSQSAKYPGWEDALKCRAKAWGWMTNMNGRDKAPDGTSRVRYVEAFRVQKQFWLD